MVERKIKKLENLYKIIMNANSIELTSSEEKITISA